MTKHHYRGADGCIIVYDVTCKESFDEVPNWYEELVDCTDPECVVVLIGNKVDLETDPGRVVSKEMARKFADTNGMMYHETSSLWD